MGKPKSRKPSVLDPDSIAQLRREVEKIPVQRHPRAEQNRLKLKAAIERLAQDTQSRDRGR